MFYRLQASPATVHWGFYDARLEPVLKVHSGDTVEVETVAGRAESLSAADLELLYSEISQLKEIHEKVRDKGPGGHILTGPIEIEGALPGDVLAISVKEVQPMGSFGWNLILPGKGTLPEDYPYTRFRVIGYDSKREYALFSSSIRVPLSPFFGHHGVAPPIEMGRVTSMIPGVHGGNMDVKELTAGSIIYLPVRAQGALYSVGDGHAVQGDGEVCLSALETCMRGVLGFELRRDMQLEWPMAETRTHVICMGFHVDLDEAAKMALRNTLHYLCDGGLSKDEAYSLSSLAVDLRIAQLVNGLKGVYTQIPKSVFSRSQN